MAKRFCTACGVEFKFKNDPDGIPKKCPKCKEPYSLMKVSDLPFDGILMAAVQPDRRANPLRAH
ncbi:MAG: hypothetical protein V1845_02480 [bacterium]